MSEFIDCSYDPIVDTSHLDSSSHLESYHRQDDGTTIMDDVQQSRHGRSPDLITTTHPTTATTTDPTTAATTDPTTAATTAATTDPTTATTGITRRASSASIQASTLDKSEHRTDAVNLDDNFVDAPLPTTEPEKNTQSYVFLFYNPKSGGNSASVLADPSLSHAVLYFGTRCVTLFLFDIRQGAPGQKPGFLKLQEVVNSFDSSGGGSIRVVVGGGDGTVVWCVSELRSYNINLGKISIGVVPFGTGNDFSHALFWDVKFQSGQDPKSELRQLVYQWLTADIIPHDLWDVCIELRDIGTFKKIDPETRFKQVLTEVNQRGQMVPIRVAKLKMCNYFSIGVESRIGVGFDRYRTKSRFWNKLRYAAEGLKKSFFKSTVIVNEIVSSMSTIDPNTGVSHEIFHCIPTTDERRETGSDYGLTVGSVSSFDASTPYRQSVQETITSKSSVVESSPIGRSTDMNASLRPTPMSINRSSAPASPRCRDPLTMGGTNTCNRRLSRSSSLESWMSEGSQAPSVHIISPDDGSTGKEEDSCDNRSDYGMSDESRHVKTEEGDISPPKFIQRKPRQSAQLQSYRPLTEIRSESGPSSLRTSCRSSNSHSIRESPTLLSAASLIAINIPSFAAGLDIWNNAHRLGLDADPDTPANQRLLKTTQKMGDGLLEFVTFSSAASIGFERMTGFQGRGKKVCQAGGPFMLEFNEMPREWRVYYQIDGEFYVMNNPLSVKISHDCTIGVLANPKSPYKRNYRMPKRKDHGKSEV